MRPDQVAQRLEWIERTLDQHVQWVLETAEAAPPGGGGAAWAAVLAHYGVAPESDEFRRKAAAEMRLTRGAVLVEVRHVLEAIVRQVRAELEGLSRLGVDGMTPPWTALESRVGSLAESEARRYQAAVQPKPAAGGGVGSIFANAKATSAKAPYRDYKMETSNVLRCPSCGGPQEVQMDFRCKYCRAPMGKP